MLQVAICDDEEICLSNTKEMLETWANERSFELKIDCFNNGDSLIRKSENNRYDIVFLDIFMPATNGMDIAKELRQKDKTVKIIFLTSSPDFALQSYSVKATDYCLKPIEYERLKEIMEECITSFNGKEPANLILKTLGGYQKIYIYDIEYIEAQNKRVFFFLKSGQVLEVVQPLYTFETELLNNNGFFKCHRSYLVYIPNVDYFSNTEIRTKSGRRIPIARGYGKVFKDAFFSIMFNDK